jgi:G:T/U-mismatch repair DNA glycosylase
MNWRRGWGEKVAILPDVLQPDLKVVFCGTAAGTQSAQAGAYYAGRGNYFWERKQALIDGDARMLALVEKRKFPQR